MTTVEIKWRDRRAEEGGGTHLSIKVNGETKHDASHVGAEQIARAKQVAAKFIADATFDDAKPAPKPSV
jgi:hypothetical protein